MSPVAFPYGLKQLRANHGFPTPGFPALRHTHLDCVLYTFPSPSPNSQGGDDGKRLRVCSGVTNTSLLSENHDCI